jgi:predicted ribosome quality control (RQC) complex YloA/Tae2 family protein
VETRVPDPYDPRHLISVSLDPRLSIRANADRLFERARRVERGRRQVEARLAETRAALALAEERQARADRARDRADLEPSPSDRRRAVDDGASRPRHYLTSRGLSILVGRGAKENHHLTFAVARPEDIWLHARDVPGAHVILRDNEGRAGPEDEREAAEVAAFFSDARTEGRIDVHVTRRKHVHAAGGGPGRVKVAHSETLRVAPRDPEGRLRRR